MLCAIFLVDEAFLSYLSLIVLLGWALAHFLEVRYPLPTPAFIFLIFLLARRSNARRSTSGSLSEKGLNHSSLSMVK
jgi:hypothetical protein